MYAGHRNIESMHMNFENETILLPGLGAQRSNLTKFIRYDSIMLKWAELAFRMLGKPV